MTPDRSQRGDEIARNVQRQTGGRWVVWFGHFTGHLWAIPRGRYWDGHIEAVSAVELLARIGEVDAWFGSGGIGHGTEPARHARTGHGRPAQPSSPPKMRSAARVPRRVAAPMRRAVSGAWSLV